ncbi:hypothetical protein [Streptomyces sp. NPDC003688]
MLSGADDFAARVAVAIDTFIDRIEAARDILQVATPAIMEADSSRHVVQRFLSQLKYLTDEEMKDVFELFKRVPLEDDEDSSPWPVRLLNAVWEEFKGKSWTSKLATELHAMLRRPSRIRFLRESTVVSAVTSFEVLFSSLIAAFLKVSPQALESMSKEKDKEFSLKDLKGMSSIDEAVDMAVSRRVDDLMFGSFSEWRRFCIDKLNIKFEDLCNDWPSVQEIFQRRHVLVHAGGIASHRYVTSTSSNMNAPDITVGQRIETTEEYAIRTLDSILCFGLLLASSIGMKFAKQHEEQILNSLHKLSYDRLIVKDYEIVQHLCTAGEKTAIESEGKLLFKVNGWIAGKKIGPKLAIREVESWDISALDDRYKLAKLCLLERAAEALPIMKKMHAAGDLSSEDVLEWPLFEDIRKTPEYIEWSKSISLPFGITSLLSEDFYLNPRTKTLHVKNCHSRGSAEKVSSLTQYDPKDFRLCSRCTPFPQADQIGARQT